MSRPVTCRCHGRKFTSEQSLGLHFWHERRKRIAELKAAGYSTVHAKTVAAVSIAGAGIR